MTYIYVIRLGYCSPSSMTMSRRGRREGILSFSRSISSITGALGAGCSRATLIATKTFSLPFFTEPPTPSPLHSFTGVYLASPPSDSSCCYLRHDGGDGRLHCPLPTNYSADQRIHRRRSASRQRACTGEAWKRSRARGRRAAAVRNPYVLRETRVPMWARLYSHQRTRRHTFLLHSYAADCATPVSTLIRREGCQRTQINSFTCSSRCLRNSQTRKRKRSCMKHKRF